LLRYIWHLFPPQYYIVEQFAKLISFPSVISWAHDAVAWINVAHKADAPTMIDLMRPLGILGLALFGSLTLRNAFPTVRTSTRGMLIEFSNSWLPMGWD